ncbi:MAG: hypothetical protein LBP55_02130 [Candidatus Adiutrix sp.]|nr:hypothetical protein [Candidatus Adiutrix sp.]
MRSIFFDELLEPEANAVLEYLDREAVPSGLNNLYWLPLPRDLWNETQIQAQREKGRTWTGADNGLADDDGYRLAVELGPDWVRFELLIRSESLLNIGGGQADERQTLFVLRWADEMARQINLPSCLGVQAQAAKGE